MLKKKHSWDNVERDLNKANKAFERCINSWYWTEFWYSVLKDDALEIIAELEALDLRRKKDENK